METKQGNEIQFRLSAKDLRIFEVAAQSRSDQQSREFDNVIAAIITVLLFATFLLVGRDWSFIAGAFFASFLLLFQQWARWGRKRKLISQLDNYVTSERQAHWNEAGLHLSSRWYNLSYPWSSFEETASHPLDRRPASSRDPHVRLLRCRRQESLHRVRNAPAAEAVNFAVGRVEGRLSTRRALSPRHGRDPTSTGSAQGVGSR